MTDQPGWLSASTLSHPEQDKDQHCLPVTERVGQVIEKTLFDNSVGPDEARHVVHHGAALDVLPQIASGSVDLIYIDPPFNTGKQQRRRTIRTTRDKEGTRSGFKGQAYREELVRELSYDDKFADYLGWLSEHLGEALRVLSPTGTIYLHLDYREVHYAKVLMDKIFGRDSFQNEVIWAYDFGGRSKRRWPRKHDNILVYTKDPKKYTFNREDVDRIPYMAPGLVTEEKRKRGKFPTDVWWHTIVPTNGKERTGYPTQKPLGILRRIIRSASNPDDLVLDFFAGSGTTAFACMQLGRRSISVDENSEAISTMRARFNGVPDVAWVLREPTSV